jgi:RNA polymerase sigma-70 factor (ECF subfamily)
MHRLVENISDSELTKAIKSSDASAFKVLYYRYYKQLFIFLWRRTQNEETAKDLSQELFFRLWKNREHLDANQSLKSYLYKIAHNLVIDHLRKRGVEQTYFTNEQPNAAITDEESDDFELREKINATMSGLPDSVRQVFYLSRFEGLKYSEIADALDIAVKTVEARMSKALTILREKLKPYI